MYFATFVFMGDFNLPDIKWEHHTANANRLRGFLKHPDDNFLGEVLRELTCKGILLDMLLVNRVSWVKWQLEAIWAIVTMK